MQHYRSSLAIIMAALATVSCGKSAPPAAPQAPAQCPVQNITVSILSSPTINRSRDGEARPVVVRLYQLKADARLVNTSFEQIWKDEKTTLGEDLVSSREMEIFPGTRTDVAFERAPTVNHVAGVGLFATPTGHAWLYSFDLPPVPEPGKCGAGACAPGDDDCENANADKLHLIYYIDGNKIDDGVEHLEEYPSQGKMKTKTHG
ncbi:MAG: type VI secretion system lipoprotein TssJ [Polyangiaceae bacterium]|nr:type VI secretion system lipoprotein TssJ [Polyangiaceae bacterium]